MAFSAQSLQCRSLGEGGNVPLHATIGRSSADCRNLWLCATCQEASACSRVITSQGSQLPNPDSTARQCGPRMDGAGKLKNARAAIICSEGMLPETLRGLAPCSWLFLKARGGVQELGCRERILTFLWRLKWKERRPR